MTSSSKYTTTGAPGGKGRNRKTEKRNKFEYVFKFDKNCNPADLRTQKIPNPQSLLKIVTKSAYRSTVILIPITTGF
jgi:hypothetical protein